MSLRIGIVRITSFGDVVHTLPVAHAIRQHDPTIHIAWMGEERAQVLLAGNPVVDEYVPVPIRRWQGRSRNPLRWPSVAGEFWTFARHVRSLRLDALVDVQGLLKSAMLMLAVRAPMRVGFATDDAREFSSVFLTHKVVPPASAIHVVDRNLSLLAPLGITAREVAFPLPQFPGAAARMDEWFGRQRLAASDRVIALLPATRRATKQWPPDRFLELARRLQQCSGVRFVLPVGPGEDALAQPFADVLGASYLALPPTGVPDLVELFKRVALVVGNDTGPLHVAAAVGARAIGLFGPTRGERNGPYGPNGRWISSPSGRMSDIAVDTVFDASLKWLRPLAPRSPAMG